MRVKRKSNLLANDDGTLKTGDIYEQLEMIEAKEIDNDEYTQNMDELIQQFDEIHD